jgi:hypothetical protein
VISRTHETIFQWDFFNTIQRKAAIPALCAMASSQPNRAAPLSQKRTLTMK